eukprot:TRINITY_DN9403_c1_g1_i4.p1 TRINITY_DN9403_c1_g1~~TRINITY_DN9403_c1_g1_i4.p1  ORF type:complete len:485 (+),score=103.63 TRINITY_DN9403_c1_g1_i4:55-1455(+)
MEEFKDVMLSEPPARGYAGESNVGGMRDGGISGGRSFENYKGILLCDRPSDQRLVVGITEQPFLPPGRPERDLFGMPGRDQDGCLGLQPSSERVNRNNVARQARNENGRNVQPTALSKHRKWLKTLTADTKRLKLNQIEAALEKEERQKRFQESERIKRLTLRDGQETDGVDVAKVLGKSKSGSKTVASSESEYATEKDSVVEQDSSPRQDELPVLSPSSLPAAEQSTADKIERQPSAPSSKKKSKAKPKWAMTEDEAFDTEMRDAEKLVDFAMNLDYDTFIEDYEVREALSIMRQRVEELAAQKGCEITRTSAALSDTASISSSQFVGDAAEKEKARAERRAARRAAHEKDWDTSSNIDDKVTKLIGNDALQLADYILAKSETLKQIHSKQSLAKILEDVAVNKNINIDRREKTIPLSSEVQKPVISDITGDTNTSMKQKRILTDLKHSKEYVQNLPYLYRCPSI